METNGSRKKIPWRTVIAAILAVLVLIFVVQNWAKLSMKFLWATFTAPGWLMLGITLVVGIVIGLLFSHRRGERDEPDQK